MVKVGFLNCYPSGGRNGFASVINIILLIWIKVLKDVYSFDESNEILFKFVGRKIGMME
jgi:hypothetical protein